MTSWSALKLAYVGDIANNVTYDLCRAAAILGCQMAISGPITPGSPSQFDPDPQLLAECRQLNSTSGGSLTVTDSPSAACDGAHAIITDTWQSYHLDSGKREERKRRLEGWRVTEQLMKRGAADAVFMHCLPALRGEEVEAAVMDGPQSVVYDEAENRLHAQKALMLWLMGKGQPRKA